MNMPRELILIGRELILTGSDCHGDDYIEAFFKKYPGSDVSHESITRWLRKLREQDLFQTPDGEKGIFYVVNQPATYISSGSQMSDF